MLARKHHELPQQPEPTSYLMDDLLKRVNEMGSPNLTRISKEEQQKVEEWYRESFNTLDEDQRIDYMEEFIKYKVMDEELAWTYVTELTDENRTRLGTFMIDNIEHGIYLSSFYKCWEALSQTEQGKRTQQRLINTARKTLDTQTALMIAPFHRLAFIEFETGELDPFDEPIKTNLLAKTLKCHNRATKAVNSIVTHFERTPTQNKTEQNERKSIINDVNYDDNLYLLPHIKTLIKQELISPDWEYSGFVYPGTEVLLTEEEKKEWEAIKKELLKHNPEPQVEHNHFSTLKPAHLALKYMKLEQLAENRSTEMHIKSLDTLEEHYNQPKLNRVAKLLENNLPALRYVDQLGLSKSEIQAAILLSGMDGGEAKIAIHADDLSDIKALIAFDRAHPEESPGLLETVIVKQLLHAFMGDRFYECTRSILFYAEEFFNLLEPHNKRQLVEAITHYHPEYWFRAIPFAQKENIDLTAMINGLRKNPEFIIDNYSDVVKHLQHTEGALDLLKEALKEGFEKKPEDFLFYSKLPIVTQNFSETERQDFIDQHISWPMDPWKFAQMITNKHSGVHKDRLLHIVLEHPEIVTEHNYTEDVHQKLIEWMGETRYFDFLVDNTCNIASIRLGEQRDAFLLHFLKQTEKHAQYIRSFLEKGNGYDAADIIERIQEEKLEYTREPFGEQTEIKQLERSIASRTHYVLGLASPEKYFDYYSSASTKERKAELIGELAVEIGQMQRELGILKKQHRAKKQKRRKHTLTEDQKKQIAQFRSAFLKQIEHHCQENPGFATNSSVLDINELEIDHFVKRDIEAVAEKDPSILFVSPLKSAEAIRKLAQTIGMPLFKHLAQKHKNALLHNKKARRQIRWHARWNRYPKTPLGDLCEELIASDPFPFEEKEKLDGDYYELTIQRHEKKTFFFLYGKRIRAIAEEQQRLHGNRTHTRRFKPHPEFQRLIQKIDLLEQSPFAKWHKTQIKEMRPEEQAPFIDALTYVTLHGLGTNLLTNHDIRIDAPQQATEYLLKLAAPHLKTLFELKDTTEVKATYLTPKLLQAMSIYYRNTCTENETMKEAFQTMAQSIVSGTYESWRTWGTKEPPTTEAEKEQRLAALKQEQLLPKHLTLEQYEQWNEVSRGELNEVLEWDIAFVQKDIRNTYNEAIADGHIEEHSLRMHTAVIEKTYHELTSPITEMAREMKELKKQFDAAKKARKANRPHTPVSEAKQIRYKELQRTIADHRKEKAEEFLLLEGHQYLQRLPHISIEELKQRQLFIGKKHVRFSKVFRTLREAFVPLYPQFASNIEAIQQKLDHGHTELFGDTTVSKTSLSLTDKIDPERYIHIGEEPVPSCQSFDSQSGDNQGLLAFMTDPNVRIIQVANEQGQMIARSALRLLEDEHGNPHIFLERIYTVNAHAKVYEAVQTVAKKKAEAMGLKLLSRESFDEAETLEIDFEQAEKLYSHSTRSNEVYTDAGQGSFDNGKYTFVGLPL